MELYAITIIVYNELKVPRQSVWPSVKSHMVRYSGLHHMWLNPLKSKMAFAAHNRSYCCDTVFFDMFDPQQCGEYLYLLRDMW